MANITERRNSKGELTGWKVTCCVGRDETYRQIWKTRTIKIDEITATTPKAMQKQAQRIADEWAETVKADYEKNGKTEKVSKEKVTLANFIRSKWLLLRVNNGQHTPTTTAFYEAMARDILEYFGEHIQLSKIDGETIEAYQIAMRTKLKTKQGKPYSETTIRRHLETLRNVLNYAKTHKYIKENPFEETHITTTKKEENHIDFLTPEEAAAFIEALSSESLQWQIFMRILLFCGLRRGECTALQWRDLSIEQRKITVCRNCTVDSKSEDGFSIGTTKSGKKRAVFFTENIADLLTQYKAEQLEKYGEIKPDYFLFHTPKDQAKPIYPTTATTWLKRFMKKHDMRQISPHDLRHSCGTLQKMAGISTKDIAAQLGHSDTKTTNRFYVEADDYTQQRIPGAIEGLIEQKQN